MKYARKGLLVALLLLTPSLSEAAIPALYTNDNFWTSEHDKPLSFSVDALGNFEGVTETGKIFRQTNVPNSSSIRLQRFSIDEAFFYISDKGVIIANSDQEALEKYNVLAL
jgi:hypothetical protein